MALPDRLDGIELERELADRPAWKREGLMITRTAAFPSFTAAIRAVDAIALIAEELNHHPDIDIRWRTVRLALTTHDVGGLSTLDIEAARRIDALVTREGGISPSA